MVLSLEKQLLVNRFNELGITLKKTEKALQKASTKKNISRKQPVIDDLTGAVETLNFQLDELKAFITILSEQ